jgi:excisionase family DNA binding protein
MAKRWYSIKEAAEALDVSHDTVSRLIERGELPALRVSERVVRIPAPAFDFYAAGRAAAPRGVVRRRIAEGVEFGAGESTPELEPA